MVQRATRVNREVNSNLYVEQPALRRATMEIPAAEIYMRVLPLDKRVFCLSTCVCVWYVV